MKGGVETEELVEKPRKRKRKAKAALAAPTDTKPEVGCQAYIAQLPADAKPATPLAPNARSYTLRKPGASGRINVVLYHRVLYIPKVDEIPLVDGKPLVSAKINKLGGLTLYWRYAPTATWEMAKVLAGW